MSERGTFIPIVINPGEVVLVDTRDGTMWGFCDGQWQIACPPPRINGERKQ